MDTRRTAAEGENSGSAPERAFDFEKNEVFENGAALVTLLAFSEPTDTDDVRERCVRVGTMPVRPRHGKCNRLSPAMPFDPTRTSKEISEL